MAPPVPQAVGTLTDGIGAISVPWPAHQADDIGLLFIETMGEAVPAVSGWTQIPDSPQRTGAAAASDTELTIYWKRAAGSAEADASVGDSGNHQIAVIGTVRGCIATGDPFDVTAGDVLATADTAVSIPGDTTTVADCLIVAASSAGTDTTTPQFSAWANADLTSVAEWFDLFAIRANGGGFGVATGVKAAAGAFGATTATLATSSKQGRIVIALKPPAGGPEAKAVSDSAAVGVTEAQDSLLSSTQADTAAVGLTEAQASFLTSARADTLAVALQEQQASLLLSAVTDTVAVAVAEATGLSVLVSVADSLGVVLTEDAALLISEAKEVSDALAVALTEAQESLGLLERTDTVALVLTEAQAIEFSAVTIEVAVGDNLVVVFLEALDFFPPHRQQGRVIGYHPRTGAAGYRFPHPPYTIPAKRGR